MAIADGATPGHDPSDTELRPWNTPGATVEGSFGFDLEIVAERTDGRIQHYWRDGSGWHEGPVIGVSV